jgi:cytochrome P450
MELADIDLSKPRFFVSCELDEAWRTLRARAPVYWNPVAGGTGFWAVTRHDDALRIYNDPTTFSNAGGNILNRNGVDPLHASGKMLAFTDPPRHRKLRAMLNRAFNPRVVNRLEDVLRATAADTVERVQNATCDVVSDVAARLPVVATCALMGIPAADWDLVLDLTQTAFGHDDPDFRGSLSSSEARSIAHTRLLGYCLELAAERRKRPRNDVISVMTSSKIDGAPLTNEELMLNCDNLIVGGNETARHGITGGILAFARHEDEWSKLRRDPTVAAFAVEEVLRWWSPGMHVKRTATRDVDIRGTRIERGQTVTVWNPAANHDEDAFPRAGSFDILRFPNRHLALGSGIHYCIGAGLARLEMRLLFEELARRVQSIELVGRIEPLQSNLIRGIKHLGVRLHC